MRNHHPVFPSGPTQWLFQGPPVKSKLLATAACELNDLRERWLNPPVWIHEEILEFPATPDGP